MRTVLTWLLQLYRFTLSPIIGSTCRFYPSCSCYALTALELHGSLRGCRLILQRLSRCHPWNPGGYDPVPPTSTCRIHSSHG